MSLVGALLLILFLPCAVQAQDQTRHEIDRVSLAALESVMGRHPFEAFRGYSLGEDDETRDAWIGHNVNGATREALGVAALVGPSYVRTNGRIAVKAA